MSTVDMSITTRTVLRTVSTTKTVLAVATMRVGCLSLSVRLGARISAFLDPEINCLVIVAMSHAAVSPANADQLFCIAALDRGDRRGLDMLAQVASHTLCWSAQLNFGTPSYAKPLNAWVCNSHCPCDCADGARANGRSFCCYLHLLLHKLLHCICC